MDDELSPRARELIAQAMAADLPPPAVADGSWEVVISRLTIEAAKEIQVPQPRGAAPRWIGVVVLGVALAVAGALLWLVLQPRAAVPPMPGPAAGAPTSSPPAATSAPVEVRAPTGPHHHVVDATALLDEAEAAEPARALELLAQHAEVAPLGAGTERRMALRIAALCALGRTDDARADAHAFLGQPRDPKWTRQVRASCAGP